MISVQTEEVPTTNKASERRTHEFEKALPKSEGVEAAEDLSKVSMLSLAAQSFRPEQQGRGLKFARSRCNEYANLNAPMGRMTSTSITQISQKAFRAVLPEAYAYPDRTC